MVARLPNAWRWRLVMAQCGRDCLMPDLPDADDSSTHSTVANAIRVVSFSSS